jgi:hypothetical protein
VAQYDVHVEGARGTVVGDYATVFQVFAGAERGVADAIRSLEFATLLDERTRDFIGRDFVFAAVERVLRGDEGPSGYVVIRGEPGIGKTAIAAQLVKANGWVHHFNVAQQGIRSPRDFLRNVCAQLIARHELDHTALAADAGEDSGFLSRLLAEAAQRTKPIVIVVDALDEAEDTGLPPAANRLFLPKVLPEGVFMILTTREDHDYRLDVDRATDIWLRDDDPANQADVRRYVERFVEEHDDAMAPRIAAWRLDRAAFAEQLTALSEGNFMYLVYVLVDIERGRLTPENAGDIGELPRGLRSYYQRHWREMRDADRQRFEEEQRPVLCMLAIAREPVPPAQVGEWTGLEPSRVRGVLAEWRQFLNESPGGAYRLYHRSFADFLDAEEDLAYYHRQIADAALAKVPGLGLT